MSSRDTSVLTSWILLAEVTAPADPTLAANRHEFVAMWGPEVLAAIEKGNAV